jgi:hypothetical protein
MHGEKPADVMVVSKITEHIGIELLIAKVAHGHLLRAFAKRWLKYPLETPLSMMLEPGAIGILRFVRWLLLERICIDYYVAINITMWRNRPSCWAWDFQPSENHNCLEYQTRY